MNTGIIYKITNLKHLREGKLPLYYIGSKKFLSEWEKGEYYGSSASLKKDIDTYGKTEFSREILETIQFTNHRELVERELDIIKGLNAVQDLAYYNLACRMSGPYDESEASAMLSKAVKQVHLKRPEEEKKAIHNAISKTLLEYQQSLTIEQRTQRSDKARMRITSTPDHIRQQWENKRSNTTDNKSDAEKDEITKKRLRTHYELPEEQRVEITKKRLENGCQPTDPIKLDKIRKKAAATKKAFSPEKKAQIKEARLNTMSQRTESEIIEMRKKMSSPGKSKPNAKTVITPEGLFYTIKDAAEHHNLYRRAIHNRCRSTDSKWAEWKYSE